MVRCECCPVPQNGTTDRRGHSWHQAGGFLSAALVLFTPIITLTSRIYRAHKHWYKINYVYCAFTWLRDIKTEENARRKPLVLPTWSCACREKTHGSSCDGQQCQNNNCLPFYSIFSYLWVVCTPCWTPWIWPLDPVRLDIQLLPQAGDVWGGVVAELRDNFFSPSSYTSLTDWTE